MPEERGELVRRARHNRKDPTRSELRLWTELRGRALGVRFRREDPIGDYIADFSCRQRRLIIEVDGDSHDDQSRDHRRDEWFRQQGWTVLRLPNEYVLDHTTEAIDLITRVLEDPTIADSIGDPG